MPLKITDLECFHKREVRTDQLPHSLMGHLSLASLTPAANI